MTPDQETELMARLTRIEANLGLVVEGLRLVCQELGIRERLREIATEVRDTIPAPAVEATNGE